MVSRRAFLRHSGIALGSIALAGHATAADYGTRPEEFVSTDGPRFSLNGESYYLAGTNNFWLADNYETKENVRELLDNAAALDSNVVRTWGFNAGRDHRSLQPSKGEYDEAAFEHLDYIVDQAAEHGIRLILPLSTTGARMAGCPSTSSGPIPPTPTMSSTPTTKPSRCIVSSSRNSSRVRTLTPVSSIVTILLF